MFALLLAVALQQGVPATPADSTVRADSARRARLAADSLRHAADRVRDSVRRAQRRELRRVPVTPELDRTAYADATARRVIARARSARLEQDSLLVSYDAKVYQRMTAGINFRATGRDRIAYRSENAARVQWMRGVGAWVDLTGARQIVPVAALDDDDPELSDLGDIEPPIPYFPGREQLPMSFIGMNVVKADVDDGDIRHPLARGAEAYYRYSTGDSLTLVAEGRRIRLREVRAVARRPEFRVAVGSYWFDEESGALVRAVMRMSAPLEVWKFVREEEQLERAVIEADTALVRDPKKRAAALEDAKEDVPRAVSTIMNPMRMEITAITSEYELREGRFWLPRGTSFEGSMQMMFVRVPVKIEQTFKYASVNGLQSLPPLPPPEPRVPRAPRVAADTTVRDSAAADSVRRARGISINVGGGGADVSTEVSVDSVRDAERARRAARGAARRAACDTASTWVRTVTRYDGALRYAMRIPCDTTVLSRSPDLPPSIYDAGDEVFSTADRDELMGALRFALQPLAPTPPSLYYGLDLVRYNRVEGLSAAVGVKASPGKGWVVDAQARLGTADLQPNGELGASRSNGRDVIGVGVFRRLAAANDRGAPLGFGSSISHFLFGRDEGFYYRTWGAELVGTRGARRQLAWRLFAERHDAAGRETNFSLAHAIAGTDFIENIEAREGLATGGAATLAFTRGLDPRGFRLSGDARAEGAFGDFDYARGAVDLTLSRALVGRTSGALTAAGGYSGGALPRQRQWYLGGSQTVRGQVAGTQSGDAFWLGRAELGWDRGGVRPTVFGDVGWAGPRDLLLDRPGRVMSGAGVGASVLDGLLRLDLARGIRPEQHWRLDLYVEARF